MGASSGSCMIKAKSPEQLNKKFSALQHACQVEYGTDPYNGTWSTLMGVNVVNDPRPDMKRWTERKYVAVRNALLEAAETREYALAVKTPKGWLVVGWLAS